ncbi:glycosyltransferase N-terminal domain-containing protein [Paracoccus sp. (in: a-proteobacteria)]|uniref:3-deoxy-D-manno-octulosonic acid transferase n=1 Tax=Paracoccus sp. TaxID=267 RepID=UPI00289F24A7|nr:glycosyltransferase N-terminal domain-containing protein [Paracoccus sp. (in: a-proteobacteria)]
MAKQRRSETKGGATAAFYRGATAMAGAVLRPFAGAMGGDFAQRMAIGLPAVPAGGIWIHGASVGELNSARLLIEDLARDFDVSVTANSLTGRRAASGWGMHCTLAPLDLPRAVARFLDQRKPVLAVTIENEIWPNRARELSARGIAQAVIGARISARSAERWGKMPGLIAPVLGAVDLLSAQDGATEERLMQLGLRREAVTQRLNLKLLGPARIVPGRGGDLRPLTLLAASTHEGEEEIVLDAYLAALAQHPQLRLILAPRHPERGDEVAAMIAKRGLEVARRTQGQDERAPVLLADTLGEMARWYDSAAICLTGGSLVARGGHTPWEPAAHQCALLHGLYVDNFIEDYAVLDAQGASSAVTSDSLSQTVCALLGDRAAQMGQAARDILLTRAGDPEPILSQLRELARRNLASR